MLSLLAAFALALPGLAETPAASSVAGPAVEATDANVSRLAEAPVNGRVPARFRASAGRRSELLGRSTEGRAIRAIVRGERAAARRVLVVGCIHGNECAGIAVTRRLARARLPAGTVVWVVHQLNPDGFARGTRQNARGVDLNRNFGSEWRAVGRRWDAEYPGPRPFSEREARIARRLVLRVRPDVTLWFHQPQAVVRAWGPSRAAARRYARLARAPYRSLRWPPGTAPNWQNRRFPGSASFVVELPPGSLGRAAARRYARAVLRL